MKTEYALCYCKGKVSPGALAQVRKILAQAKPELLLDSSYFVPWLFPCRFRLFSPVSYTERPAVAAAKLCEGKIIVLVNGSPSAMILPTLFCENFDCLDDYATTAFFSSFLRILKYGAFYLSIFLPGAFVCTAVYLPELLPPILLFKIEAAEKATPLPLFAEMVMIILILENKQPGTDQPHRARKTGCQHHQKPQQRGRLIKRGLFVLFGLTQV